MNIYAHHCPCGKPPEYGFNNYHTWNGQSLGGTCFYCSDCKSSAGQIGGDELFALKVWNEKFPPHENAIRTAELRWNWPVMGGHIDGSLTIVASKGDSIIHPVTGKSFEWPHTLHEYATPMGRFYIRLSPTKKKEQKQLIKLLTDFTGQERDFVV